MGSEPNTSTKVVVGFHAWGWTDEQFAPGPI